MSHLSSPELPVDTPSKPPSVLERTRQQYAEMSPEEQHAFKLALACTLGGMALNAANALVIEPRLSKSDNRIIRWVPTAIRGVSYGFDHKDGDYARRGRTYDESGEVLTPGAVTALGEVLDPLADKFNNLLNELAAVRFHHQPAYHVIIRLVRDLAVSWKRRKGLEETGGELSVAANNWGKINTLLRDIVNTYASSPVGEEYPLLTELLQIAEDITSIVSGVHNINAINDGLAEHARAKTASHESAYDEA